jgi:hypothetical protein
MARAALLPLAFQVERARFLDPSFRLIVKVGYALAAKSR